MIEKTNKNKEDLDKTIDAQKAEVQSVKSEVVKVLTGIKALETMIENVQQDVTKIEATQRGRELI